MDLQSEVDQADYDQDDYDDYGANSHAGADTLGLREFIGRH